MRTFLALATLALVAACASTHREHAEPAVAPTALAELFPVPARGLSIPFDPKTPYGLARLLDDWSDASGWALLISAPTRTRLEATPLGLNRALELAPRDAQRFVEDALAQNRFAFVCVSTSAPRVLAVVDAETRESDRLRASARALDEHELAAWAEHPAFYVTTAVALETADADEVLRSLRPLLEDSNVQALVSVAAHRVLLYGSGAWVASMRDLVRQFDLRAEAHAATSRGGSAALDRASGASPPVPIADAASPPGKLGPRLGTYLRLEGVRDEQGKVDHHTLAVDRVGETKLPTPIAIGLDGIDELPRGERCIVHGYETGAWIGLPDEVRVAEKLPMRQAAWQLHRTFVVTSVEAPASLAARFEKR